MYLQMFSNEKMLVGKKVFVKVFNLFRITKILLRKPELLSFHLFSPPLLILCKNKNVSESHAIFRFTSNNKNLSMHLYAQLIHSKILLLQIIHLFTDSVTSRRPTLAQLYNFAYENMPRILYLPLLLQCFTSLCTNMLSISLPCSLLI